jgi:acetyl esterase/lipase
MKQLAMVALVLAAACGGEKAKESKASPPPVAAADAAPAPKAAKFTLPGARNALKTAYLGERDTEPAPKPPADVLEMTTYRAPLGQNVAYVTPVKAGAKRPAVIWLHGGFSWGLGDTFFTDAPRENDQSGSAFRKAGLVEMYPALRGGSGNPGTFECFLGEVDDVLAAADFLATRPDVDPERIYLAGHSTGAVLVLLAVESTDRFRAAFAFGPVGSPVHYGESSCVPQDAPERELIPRSPILFMSEIVTPTFIIEGDGGNAAVVPYLVEEVGSAVKSVIVPGRDHFDVLAPGTEVVADAIVKDADLAKAITADAILAKN